MPPVINNPLKKSKNLDQHTKGPLNMALLCVSIFTGLILLAFGAEKSVGLTIILEPIGLTSTIAPILIMGLYLHNRASVSIFEVMFVLGIPIGLLGCMIGLHGMAMYMNDATKIGPANGIMLLTALYGAIVSCLGYFFLSSNREIGKRNISLVDFIFCIIVLNTTIMFAIYNAIDLRHFWNPGALALHLGFAIWAIFLREDKKKSIVNCISDAAIGGMIVGLVLALLAWYQTSPDVNREAIGFGCMGVFYGIVIYIHCYFLSLLLGGSEEINFPVKNWHLIEANTFYIFLIFAPVNLGESLLNKAEEIDNADNVIENRNL